MYLDVQLQKVAHQECCNPRCCSRFIKYFLLRLVGHKMFMHPVHVDLVDQFASSILAQTAVLSESSVPSGIAHPSSSCIPLSRCKQLVVCRGGRLHATLSGKTSILSLERVSNRINILYSDEVFQVFCVEQSLPCQVAWSFLLGFTIVKNTDCLPRLRLCPPGINPLLIIECTSLTFPTW